MTFLGLLILLIGIAAGFYPFVRSRLERAEAAGINARRGAAGALPEVLPFNRTFAIIGAVIGLPLIFFAQLVFYADPGVSYLVQYPWGTQRAELTPGIHLRLFGNVIEFKNVMTVDFDTEHGADDDQNSGNDAPIEVRFNDAVTAHVMLTSRFQMPTDPEKFKTVALEFRSQSNLVNSALIPNIKEASRNAARMYSAQEYIGGKGGDFENAISDQIAHGIYLLDVDQERATGQAPFTQDDDRSIEQGQINRVSVNVRRTQTGEPVRKGGAQVLERYGISMTQTSVSAVDPDPAFKKKLDEQRDAAAQVSIERQNTRKEEERKNRIIAQGEAEKAEISIALQKKQIEQTVAAETMAKVAGEDQKKETTQAQTRLRVMETDKATKQIELESSKLEAQRIETLAKAEAYRRQSLMQADNALQAKLDALIQINANYANAIGKQKIVPDVVMGGNGNSSSSMDLVSLLTAQTAKQLSVDINNK